MCRPANNPFCQRLAVINQNYVHDEVKSRLREMPPFTSISLGLLILFRLAVSREALRFKASESEVSR